MYCDIREKENDRAYDICVSKIAHVQKLASGEAHGE